MQTTLKGNCHCGSYRFELRNVNLEEGVVKCDGRLCRKKGCLWLCLDDGVEFEVMRDEGRLVEYQAGDGKHEVSLVYSYEVVAVTETWTVLLYLRYDGQG